MKRARRPPLHPNCRSTLIPVVDLIDPETGEKIEETAERPAQNADGSYSQVAAKTTFKDYFESQPETFQREWLGEKRFELWKSGKLKFEDLAKPATTYRATPADLTPPTEKPKETAASDDKPSNAPASLADAIRGVGGEDAAAILRRYAADAKAQAPQADATRPVVGERREPLFKGAATTEKIVPFEPKFSARETIIFKEMERNRQEASEILKQEGREILPLGKRAQHFIIEARNLGLSLKTLPNGANISGPCTVDRYRDGKWQQRRWYDANGDAEQDYDAAHDGKDVKNSHIFPHLHIWTKNKAGIRCKRSGACATHTRIKKNDRLDD